jgi:hypothetical protein
MRECLEDEEWKKQALEYVMFASQLFPEDTFKKDENIELFLSGILFLYALSQFEDSKEIN